VKEMTSNMISMFTTTLSSFSHSTPKSLNVEKSEVDVKLEEYFNSVLQLETQVNNVHKHVTLLIKRDQERMLALSELSQSTTALAQLETDTLTDTLSHISSTTNKLAIQSNQFSDKLQLEVELPLQGIIHYIGAVKSAYQRRQHTRQVHATALASLEAQQIVLQKTLTNPSTSPDVRTSKQNILSRISSEVATQGEVLSAATRRFERDYLEFKGWFASELKATLSTFIRLQIDISVHTERAWADLSAVAPAGADAIATGTAATGAASVGGGQGDSYVSYNPYGAHLSSSTSTLGGSMLFSSFVNNISSHQQPPPVPGPDVGFHEAEDDASRQYDDNIMSV